MDVSTVKLHKHTKRSLDRWREYRGESYDELICKLVDIAQTAGKEPKRSQQAVWAVEAARERIRSGQRVSEAEAKKRFGVEKKGWSAVSSRSLSKVWDNAADDKAWNKY